MTAPSIRRPEPDLATPRVVDIEAWREDMRKKAAENAARRALDLAALISQLDARKVKPKRRHRKTAGAA